MLLVVTAIALLITVPLAGGRLTRLADIRVRATWAVLLAVAIQVGISDVAPGGSHWVHVALNIASYTARRLLPVREPAARRRCRSSPSAPRSTSSRSPATAA